jgi:S1-C subfamily serine protease
VNLVDVVIAVAAVGYGVAGYRNGLLSGLFSLGGFVGGALVGAQVAQPLGRRMASGQAQVPIAIVCLLFCALFGQFLGVWIATVLRRTITWHPARHVDEALGAVLGVFGALFVAWMVALPLASAPYPSLARLVRQSSVVHAVDTAMPDPMRRVYANVRRFVDRSDFPQVFGALGSTHVVDVPAPNQALLDSAAVRAVRGSVVKIYSDAPSCSRESEGSGFVYARGRVLTNAHVVAGGSSFHVVTSQGRLAAQVVLYDPKRDVAILAVPGLTAKPLRFAGAPARTSQDALVLGYPRDGPFDVQAARVRNRQDVSGDDIYGRSGVEREIYAVRALVRSGNSGGPLIDSSGHVLGVVFASAIDSPDTGFVLTADEITPDTSLGVRATAAADTQGCT